MITCERDRGKWPPPALATARPSTPTPLDRLDPLRRRFAALQPLRLAPAPDARRAAVALVVRPAPRDLEVLLIKRAEHPRDPWSGHVALPGGRHEPADRSVLQTAIRETEEEVGLELADPQRLIGRLDDVQPLSGTPRMLVSSFVFAADADAVIRPNPEVAAGFWVPFGTLAARGAATEYLHALTNGSKLRFPALAYREHVIWGLTYRIVKQFLEITRTAVAADGDE